MKALLDRSVSLSLLAKVTTLALAGLLAFNVAAATKSTKPKTSAKPSKSSQPNPNKLAPPPGIPVPTEVKAELNTSTEALGKEIGALRTKLAGNPAMLELLPDVQVFYNAVRYALDDDIFYSTAQFATAKALLKQGMERAAQLAKNQAPWNSATGLVVRGYVSRLDGSVQPYGLVVPPDYKPSGKPYRLDFWFHGRGDTLSEISFIEGRQKSAGTFTPDRTLVLHPYGRFCNAYKFAGEMDVFESLEHVCKHYPIDTNRVSVRGFSMGGAATWHIGAHHAWLWAGINPGAGFVDVVNYQKLADQLDTIPWYERKLWGLYDPLACPINLANSTLVTYSGEEDGQRASAELMGQALAKEGITMTHIIGPKTGHKYEPGAQKKVAELMDAAAAKGRATSPERVRLVTYSLKFSRMHWVEIEGLEKHWERAEVDAEAKKGAPVTVKTKNVTRLALHLQPIPTSVNLDGQTLATSGAARFVKEKGQWHAAAQPDASLAKRHNLQGPIDDAFMDSFIMVRPTGQPLNPELGKWVAAEMKDALFQWRRQFRGAARVKDDSAITEADLKSNHLVLWGDPSSNKLLAKIAPKLPIQWTAQGIVVAGKNYDAAKAAPVLIYPNPLSPQHYVVINSGFTFPQCGTSTNSRQTPKLPDWAILDLSVPVADRIAGKGVLAADFFGERWELQPAGK